MESTFRGGGAFAVTYLAADARRELLDGIAVAVGHLGTALADLTAAYDLLDERSADRMEDELFTPVQRAYGRAQRTHAGFAERFGLAGATFPAARPPAANRSARDSVGDAVDAAATADNVLSELQDSMMPVEVGDRELRDGLADVRTLIAPLPSRARELLRVLGR